MTDPVKTAPPTLRRIDWLAVAPWTLLFRVPGVALGKPFLVAAIATLLLGNFSLLPSGPISEVRSLAMESVHSLAAAPAEIFRQVFDPSRWQPLLKQTGWFFVWAVVGLAITGQACRSLTAVASASAGIWASIKRTLWQVPKLLGAFAMLAVLLVLLSVPLCLADGASASGILINVVNGIYPLLTLCFALPLFLVTAGVVVGWPLLVSAIVVDKADAFDGVSRLFAYTYQRIGRLLFYVGLAALVGAVSFYFLEMMLVGIDGLLQVFLPDIQPKNLTGTNNLQVPSLFATVARSYYAAYFYTAWTAIYLLLRQDIDDQPLDEMAA